MNQRYKDKTKYYLDNFFIVFKLVFIHFFKCKDINAILVLKN